MKIYDQFFTIAMLFTLIIKSIDILFIFTIPEKQKFQSVGRYGIGNWNKEQGNHWLRVTAYDGDTVG